MGNFGLLLSFTNRRVRSIYKCPELLKQDFELCDISSHGIAIIYSVISLLLDIIF